MSHFRNVKGTGAEMCPAIVSGIFTGDAPGSLSKDVDEPHTPTGSEAFSLLTYLDATNEYR